MSEPDTNRPRSSVQEGGYPDLGYYNQWEWPAIDWITTRLRGQLEAMDDGNAPTGVRDKNRIDVQPMMKGYSVQLDESDIIYHLTHEDVLSKQVSPKEIIDEILRAWKFQQNYEDKSSKTNV